MSLTGEGDRVRGEDHDRRRQSVRAVTGDAGEHDGAGEEPDPDERLEEVEAELPAHIVRGRPIQQASVGSGDEPLEDPRPRPPRSRTWVRRAQSPEWQRVPRAPHRDSEGSPSTAARTPRRRLPPREAPRRRTDAAWVVVGGTVSEARQIREVGSGSTGGAGNPNGDAQNMPGHGGCLHHRSDVAEALRDNDDREDETDEEAGHEPGGDGARQGAKARAHAGQKRLTASISAPAPAASLPVSGGRPFVMVAITLVRAQRGKLNGSRPTGQDTTPWMKIDSHRRLCERR